jgi:hypothetical protein
MHMAKVEGLFRVHVLGLLHIRQKGAMSRLGTRDSIIEGQGTAVYHKMEQGQRAAIEG